MSVVVPTRDRPERLGALLRSLARQRVPADDFEVIVVDDASSNEPLEALPEMDGIRLQVLRHESPRGPAAARNTGWRAADAPLVAFTDDDCEAQEGWLEALLAAWDGDARRIVQGQTEPLPAERSRLGPFSRTQIVGGPDMLFETCNIAYPRALLERVGGFDERFRQACGEDVELGWRAVKAGAELAFSSDALVYHAVHELGVARTIRHTWRWSDSVAALKRHPEARELLVWGVFWKPTHPPLIAGLAGVLAAALARRPALGAVAMLPYLDHYRRIYGRAAPRLLPAHLAVDLCELATMIRGSVQHRTLML